jgi:putative transposase
VTIQGERQYLWRAVERFFRKLLKGQGSEPRRLITDKLGSHGAAHQTIMPSVIHVTERYANNRAEVSHQPT